MQITKLYANKEIKCTIILIIITLFDVHHSHDVFTHTDEEMQQKQQKQNKAK